MTKPGWGSYPIYLCTDCQEYFITISRKKRKIHCPICADYVGVKKHSYHWSDTIIKTKVEFKRPDVEKLKKLYKQNLRRVEIAEFFGVKEKVIEYQLSKLFKSGELRKRLSAYKDGSLDQCQDQKES
jgi:DNA-directed RNA polymerase subunit RPC12/RpoP